MPQCMRGGTVADIERLKDCVRLLVAREKKRCYIDIGRNNFDIQIGDAVHWKGKKFWWCPKGMFTRHRWCFEKTGGGHHV